MHQDIKNLCTNDTECIETDSNETEYNDKGAFFSEERTVCLELPYRKEINQARQFFEAYYRSCYSQQYHNHKPLQNKYIDERLNDAFIEYGLDIEDMCNMIKAYFNNVECDHNLMHFVTDGILQNRMYEVAY